MGINNLNQHPRRGAKTCFKPVILFPGALVGKFLIASSAFSYKRARAAAPAAPMNPAAATRLGAAALELEAGAAPPLVLLGDVDPLPLLEAVALVERD